MPRRALFPHSFWTFSIRCYQTLTPVDFYSFLDFPSTADVEAFAKAMETETKSDQDGDPKDKKDDDEDMSLD